MNSTTTATAILTSTSTSIAEVKAHMIELNNFAALIAAEIQVIREQLISCIYEQDDLEAEMRLGTTAIDVTSEMRLAVLSNRISELKQDYRVEQMNFMIHLPQWHILQDELERFQKAAQLEMTTETA